LAVCSTAFTTLGRAQAGALGRPDLPIAVIPHPFGTRTRNEVRDMARQCAADVVALVTRKSSDE
jgi:predicted dienelactone hydrolase